MWGVVRGQRGRTGVRGGARGGQGSEGVRGCREGVWGGEDAGSRPCWEQGLLMGPVGVK